MINKKPEKEIKKIQKYENILDNKLARLKSSIISHYKMVNLNQKVWAYIEEQTIKTRIEDILYFSKQCEE